MPSLSTGVYFSDGLYFIAKIHILMIVPADRHSK
jgi:hypothetical protein